MALVADGRLMTIDLPAFQVWVAPAGKFRCSTALSSIFTVSWVVSVNEALRT